jgi:hypothetical protein
LIGSPTKLLHRCLSGLADAVAAQHLAYGQPKKPEVEPKERCLHASRLFGCVAVEIVHQQRAGADQAHIAFDDVPEFG